MNPTPDPNLLRSSAQHFHRLMQVAVIAILVAMGMHRLALVLAAPTEFATLSWGAWHACFVLHAATLVWLASPAGRGSTTSRYLAALALGTLTALAMGALKHFLDHAALLYLLQVWFVAVRFPLKATLPYALLAGLSFPLIRSLGPDYPLQRMAFEVLYTWGYSAFVLFAASALQSEAAAERVLVTQRLALLAAQEQLEESRLMEERLRISRDLHDALGHHLAALSLRLEAMRVRSPKAERTSVEDLQDVVRSMFTDLRGVVSTLQKTQPLDLEAFLTRLAEQVAIPRIQVDFSGPVPFQDSVRNHALFRCTQELVTNCFKHAGALNLWISVTCSPESVYLIVRDDGRGAAPLREGHGLAGLRERLAAFGGRLDLHAGSQGFQARVWIPGPGGTA